MRILRIVPLFKRNGDIDVFVPQLQGFSAEEELELLARVDRAVPQKKWAFVQHSIPPGYSGVMVTQNSAPERIAALREAQIDIIGYELEVRMGVKELLELCNAVAVDIHYEQYEQIISLMQAFGDKRTKKIALAVGEYAEFELGKKNGFDYFSGDFYTKVVLSDGQAKAKLDPIKANKLAILGEVSTWSSGTVNKSMDQIAQIIQRDVFLTMSLIKMANSAFFGSRGKVTQLKDALVRIGMDNISQWSIAILSTAATQEKTPVIARVALLRAKFMENLAIWSGGNRWEAFFTGLSSVADVLLGTTKEEALKEMRAPECVGEYLRYEGDIGWLLALTESYIGGDIAGLTKLLEQRPNNTIADRMYVACMDAELWVTDILSTVEVET